MQNKRILVLHGYGESAYSTRRKMAPIIAQCDDEVEFYFLDGPMNLVPIDLKVQSGDVSSAGEAVSLPPSCSTPTRHPAYPGSPRGWFKISQSGRDSIPGIEDSLTLLRETLKEHTFDGIFGFSQGAAMAELVAAMLERPELFPDFCENGIPPHPPLKYIVSVCGFLLRGPLASWESDIKTPIGDPVFGFPIYTPVLYVLGRTDIVVPRERSEIVLNLAMNKRVEEHTGAHFIPTGSRWRTFFAKFFRNPYGEIPSPTPPSPPIVELEDDDKFLPSKPLYRPATFRTGESLPSLEFEGEYTFDVTEEGVQSDAEPYSVPDTPEPVTPEHRGLDILAVDVHSSDSYGIDMTRLSAKAIAKKHYAY